MGGLSEDFCDGNMLKEFNDSKKSSGGFLVSTDHGSLEEKQVLKVLEKTALSWDYIDDWDVKAVALVQNAELEDKYYVHKSRMRPQGNRVIPEEVAFSVESMNNIVEISQKGAECKECIYSLGNPKMGLSLFRHIDSVLKYAEVMKIGSPVHIVAYKVFLGRSKMVSPRTSSTDGFRIPDVNYESHLSSIKPSWTDNDFNLLERSTVYLYEYNGKNIPVRRPRNCLPFAVVTYNSCNVQTPCLSIQKCEKSGLLLNTTETAETHNESMENSFRRETDSHLKCENPNAVTKGTANSGRKEGKANPGLKMEILKKEYLRRKAECKKKTEPTVDTSHADGSDMEIDLAESEGETNIVVTDVVNVKGQTAGREGLKDVPGMFSLHTEGARKTERTHDKKYRNDNYQLGGCGKGKLQAEKTGQKIDERGVKMTEKVRHVSKGVVPTSDGDKKYFSQREQRVSVGENSFSKTEDLRPSRWTSGSVDYKQPENAREGLSPLSLDKWNKVQRKGSRVASEDEPRRSKHFQVHAINDELGPSYLYKFEGKTYQYYANQKEAGGKVFYYHSKVDHGKEYCYHLPESLEDDTPLNNTTKKANTEGTSSPQAFVDEASIQAVAKLRSLLEVVKSNVRVDVKAIANILSGIDVKAPPFVQNERAKTQDSAGTNEICDPRLRILPHSLSGAQSENRPCQDVVWNSCVGSSAVSVALDVNNPRMQNQYSAGSVVNGVSSSQLGVTKGCEPVPPDVSFQRHWKYTESSRPPLVAKCDMSKPEVCGNNEQSSLRNRDPRAGSSNQTDDGKTCKARRVQCNRPLTCPFNSLLPTSFQWKVEKLDIHEHLRRRKQIVPKESGVYKAKLKPHFHGRTLLKGGVKPRNIPLYRLIPDVDAAESLDPRVRKSEKKAKLSGAERLKPTHSKDHANVRSETIDLGICQYSPKGTGETVKQDLNNVAKRIQELITNVRSQPAVQINSTSSVDTGCTDPSRSKLANGQPYGAASQELEEVRLLSVVANSDHNMQRTGAATEDINFVKDFRNQTRRNRLCTENFGTYGEKIGIVSGWNYSPAFSNDSGEKYCNDFFENSTEMLCISSGKDGSHDLEVFQTLPGDGRAENRDAAWTVFHTRNTERCSSRSSPSPECGNPGQFRNSFEVSGDFGGCNQSERCDSLSRLSSKRTNEHSEARAAKRARTDYIDQDSSVTYISRSNSSQYSQPPRFRR